ncbi:MAG: trypsin-like serine protease, partial [Proteobacteria bacterium]|nr:trypsin-like serine protease [Pseudomonadota bacterium]
MTTLDWPTGEIIPYALDSGVVSNVAAGSRAVFEGVVHVQDASWVRLYFGQVQLAPGSFVRMTSGLDNEVQELDAAALARWGNTSAYFNGDAVLVELVGGPKTARNRLVVDHLSLELGIVPQVETCGICDVDDREPSDQDWVGRLVPAGCTASVWNQDSCLVSVGHCVNADAVIEFRVPLSNPNCSLNHPPVADQFPIIESISVNGGVGNDWAVMRTGTNSLGQTPYERYGQLRAIATSPAPQYGTAAAWGYGVDTECAFHQVQQFSSGTLQSVRTGHYTYDIDTTDGNSGSPIMYGGEIIAVATHCNCPDNFGTRVDLPAFAAARAAICGQPCPTDINGDGVVNIIDWIEVLLCFGQPAVPGCEAQDIDEDGAITVLDLIDVILDLGVVCPDVPPKPL